MKRLTRWLLPLLFAGAAYAAFTDSLTVDGKYAFIGDSWTSNGERPFGIGGANYPQWADSGYATQSAEWVNRVTEKLGVRNYRIFATSGAEVTWDSTGIAQYIPDVLAYEPDYAFILGGINDCSNIDAADSLDGVAWAAVVVDSLESMITQLQDSGTRVCIMALHPCSEYDRTVNDGIKWDGAKEVGRLAINKWITELTESDNLAIHTDFWLEDTIATSFYDIAVDCTAIVSDYDKDGLHLNHLGNIRRGDSLWVNTLGSTTFTDPAVTFYVDWDTGHDWSNTGRSMASPWKTLQQALFRVRAGDRIEVFTDSVDNYSWKTNETFMEIFHRGYDGSPITIDCNGGIFTDPYNADAYKVLYHSSADSTYYTADSTSLFYIIENAVFRVGGTMAILKGTGDITFDGCTFTGDILDFQTAGGTNIVKNSTFWGGEIKTTGIMSLTVDNCEFYSTGTGDSLGASSIYLANTVGPVYITNCVADIDSFTTTDHAFVEIYDGFDGDILIANNETSFHVVGTSPDNRSIYSWNTGDLSDLELKNNIFRSDAEEYTMLIRGYPASSATNFFYTPQANPIYVGGAISLATWRTNTGEVNDWDYTPSATCDTVKYGGTIPTLDYSYLVRDHSSDWCSIGATQYSPPTIPGRYATPTDSDSLVDNVGWTWTAGDTISVTEWDKFILPHVLTLQQDTGVPQLWQGGWN